MKKNKNILLTKHLYERVYEQPGKERRKRVEEEESI